ASFTAEAAPPARRPSRVALQSVAPAHAALQHGHLKPARQPAPPATPCRAWRRPFAAFTGRQYSESLDSDGFWHAKYQQPARAVDIAYRLRVAGRTTDPAPENREFAARGRQHEPGRDRWLKPPRNSNRRARR